MIKSKKGYSYIIDRYYRKSHIDIIARVFNSIFSYYEEYDVFHFMCSWFCDKEIEYVKKMGFDENNFHFYDHDKFVCEINEKYTTNINYIDAVFDSVDLTGGVIINKYSEYVYPLGKIYKGQFILIGCNDESLHIPNPIKNIDQLIQQNNIQDVIFTDKWKVTREYDKKELDYFMVVGCNI